MSTTATNNLAQVILGRRLLYSVDQSGSIAFNQGDLLYFQSGTDTYATPIASDTNATYLIGVAMNSSNLALYTNALTGSANNNYESKVLVGSGDVFNFTGVAGQTYTTHLLSVYYSTDAQHVTAASASHVIGYVYNPLLLTLSGAITIPVLVVAQVPVVGAV